MELFKSIFTASPLIPLFTCIALGYAVGKIRFGQFQVGGVVGTLFAAILIGQIGVETDDVVKTLAFALFIYSLGFVSGPQFFGSLGRATLNQVHLAVFCSAVVFVTVWSIAYFADLDQGTAAGLQAGATTESASVGTAGEALRHLGLEMDEVRILEANIGVTYAVTYLFGFTLVVFFVSAIAPRMLGVDLKEAAKAYESELGGVGEGLEPGQEQALKRTSVRVYKVTKKEAEGLTVAQFEKDHREMVTIQQVARKRDQRTVTPDLALHVGDRVALLGRREHILSAGEFLGEETGDLRGMSFVGETRDVVVSNKALFGATLSQARVLLDEESRRGVYVTKLTRAGNVIELRPRTQMLAGDVATLYGPPDTVDAVAKQIGYTMDRGDAVDYVYLGLGVIVGVLVGMISVPIAGTPVHLGTGGGCLLSGLVFGWLRSKHPTFGSLPAAAALHLRDFGLAIFVATVGLAVGPQAVALLQEKGILLPFLSMVVVLVPLVTSLYYAKYVLKMNPVVICGSLAGCLTCTAGLNAIVARAESETPVLGYTVPYAIANVLLTLLGPVIVLTV